MASATSGGRLHPSSASSASPWALPCWCRPIPADRRQSYLAWGRMRSLTLLSLSIIYFATVHSPLLAPSCSLSIQCFSARGLCSATDSLCQVPSTSALCWPEVAWAPSVVWLCCASCWQCTRCRIRNSSVGCVFGCSSRIGGACLGFWNSVCGLSWWSCELYCWRRRFSLSCCCSCCRCRWPFGLFWNSPFRYRCHLRQDLPICSCNLELLEIQRHSQVPIHLCFRRRLLLLDDLPY